MSMRRRVGGLVRAIADRLDAMGLDISAVRGVGLALAGVRISWSPAQPLALPGAIYEYQQSGQIIRFFVHNADDVI